MADVTIGARLQLDASDGINSLKQLKGAIKEAQGDLIAMTEKFGATSEQARMAAKRVAELQDNIGDAKNLVDSFNPDKKFVALGQALNGVLGGFTALTGAMGLLGVESEDVQKQLLKVQSALALSQGLNQIGDSIQSFKNLGKTIVDTLGKSGAIGLAIAGVTALGLALSGVFSRKQSDAVKAYNDTLKDYTKAASDARQKVTEVRIAFEQARQGVITKDNALKIYNDTLGDSLGKTNDINEAEKLLADKAETYIKITALKAQANALFAKAANQTAEALIAQDELLKSGLTGERGVVGSAADALQSKIDRAIQGGKDIENIGANLLRQAGQLSSQFGVTTGGGTTAAGGGKSSPAVKEQKDETAEILFDWSSRRDNILLIQQQLAESLKANQRDLVDYGKQLAKEEADEKIAQKDRERENNRINAEGNMLIAEQEAAVRMRTAQSIGGALGALSDLVGRQTATGKVLAIAEATINTYLAASNILKNTARNPVTGAIPGFAIAQMIATIVSGLATVRNIAKTQVPGTGAGGGGSVPSIQSQAPLTPQSPQSTNTRLDQDQINSIGNATVRAFVVESDVTNNQDRIRRLNRAARI